MTVRRTSDTVVISDTADPGQVVYTAPKVGGAEALIVVYVTNVDGVAARNVTIQHEKGAAHTVQERINVVDAFPVEPNFPQLKLATVTLMGHKTDPDELKIFASVTADIIVHYRAEENR